MKNLKFISYTIVIAAFLLFFTSCEDESAGQPSIEYIRGVDTILALETGNLGQTVAIIGNNLATTSSVTFNGRPASFNRTFRTNNSVILTIAEETPFTGDSATSEVVLITDGGQTTFTLPVLPPNPEISAVQPLLAFEGGQLDIQGNYFYFITDVMYGDVKVEIESVTPKLIKAKVPAGYVPGSKISVISSLRGTVTSAERTDFTTGVFQNWGSVSVGGSYWNSSVDGPLADFSSLGTGESYKYIDETYGNTYWLHDGAIEFDSAPDKGDDFDDRAIRFEYNVIGQIDQITLQLHLDNDTYYEKPIKDIEPTSGRWATYTLKLSDLFFVNADYTPGDRLSKEIWGATDVTKVQWAFVNQTGGDITTKCAMTNFRFVDTE